MPRNGEKTLSLSLNGLPLDTRKTPITPNQNPALQARENAEIAQLMMETLALNLPGFLADSELFIAEGTQKLQNPENNQMATIEVPTEILRQLLEHCVNHKEQYQKARGDFLEQQFEKFADVVTKTPEMLGNIESPSEVNALFYFTDE